MPEIIPDSTEYANTLRECADIAEDRGKKYGDINENFLDASNICDVVFNLQLSPIQVTQVLRAVKMAREKHLHDPDNIKDDINYNAIGLELRKSNS